MDQKYYGEYKDKKFQSGEQMDKWLKELAVKKIYFADNGQDLLEIWIDKGGEILHCNLQAAIWNGMVVDLGRLKVGNMLPIMVPEKMATQYYSFFVKKIENV